MKSLLLVAALFLTTACGSLAQEPAATPGASPSTQGGASAPSASPAPLPAELVERYKKICTEARGRIEAALKSKGLPPLDSGATPPEIGCDDATVMGGRKIRTVHIYSGTGFWVTFDPYQDPGNEAKLRRVIRAGVEPHSTAATSLTRDQVEEQARFWFTTAFGSFPANAGRTRIGLDERITFYEGVWSVNWPRVDSRGYPFLKDSIYCELNDQYGFLWVEDNFHSTYKEGQKITITSVQAVETARAGAKKIMSKIEARFWSGHASGLASWFDRQEWKEWWGHETRVYWGHPITVRRKPYLMITNPNHIMSWSNYDSGSPTGDNEARLSWVVELGVSDSTGNGFTHQIMLWIDTETGEITGGDVLPGVSP